MAESIVAPPDEDGEAYLRAMLFEAMREERAIRVEGTVSRELLSNLYEFQLAWHRWCPDLYHPIPIEAAQVIENAPRTRGAVCAFSGGVDATFTVMRHARKLLGYRSQEIQFCALVHGFDIPLANTSDFATVLDRSREVLGDLKIGIQPITTNFRKISRANWEHTHAAALVAALSHFQHHAGTCLIGSGGAYDELVLPWGSQPVTDPLLASASFAIIHDGASHHRTDKVRAIADWEVGAAGLRVCWQGDHKDRNCGQCEKCVRTKLNFLAAGKPIPSCFPQEHDIEAQLKLIHPSNEAQRKKFQQIHETAIARGITEPWVRLLPRLYRQSVSRRIFEGTFPTESRRRKVLSRVRQAVS